MTDVVSCTEALLVSYVQKQLHTLKLGSRRRRIELREKQSTWLMVRSELSRENMKRSISTAMLQQLHDFMVKTDSGVYGLGGHDLAQFGP